LDTHTAKKAEGRLAIRDSIEEVHQNSQNNSRQTSERQQCSSDDILSLDFGHL
jgi:hypothetical protein